MTYIPYLGTFFFSRSPVWPWPVILWRHHSGGLAGLAPEPVTGIQRALGEPTGSPWPPPQPSGRQWRRQVSALEREQHPRSARRSAVPTEKKLCAPAQPAQSGTAGAVRHSRRSPAQQAQSGTAGAVARIAPGPRAPYQRSRAAQISSRVYAALVGRPADVLSPVTAPCFCAAAALSCSTLLPLAHYHRHPSSLQNGIKPPALGRRRGTGKTAAGFIDRTCATI